MLSSQIFQLFPDDYLIYGILQVVWPLKGNLFSIRIIQHFHREDILQAFVNYQNIIS